MLPAMHRVQDTTGLYAKTLASLLPTWEVPSLPGPSAHWHVGDCQLSLWGDRLVGYGGSRLLG